ncbi:dTDP-glucose 4,6-dehydratase [Enterococcus sp. AZ163]
MTREEKMKYLITGGSGFIGSNFLNLMVPNHRDIQFFNVDALTYAANNNNIIVSNYENYTFIQLDISDKEQVNHLFSEIHPDVVINFAAESHVDQSIKNPEKFIYSNIIGTFNLLQAAYASWKTYDQKRFHHISTDEVFGSLGTKGAFTELT